MLFLKGVSQSTVDAPLDALVVDEWILIRLVSAGGAGNNKFFEIGVLKKQTNKQTKKQ